MSEKQETQAEIVAEMRDAAMNGEYDDSTVNDWADRIEAAAKREKAQLGNSSAMREALARATRMLSAWRRDLPYRAWSEIDETIDKCNTALSKSPRNCDRFGGDYKMLHTAWFDWTGSPSGQNPDGTVKMAFSEWLLAPAIKKGGAK